MTSYLSKIKIGKRLNDMQSFLSFRKQGVALIVPIAYILGRIFCGDAC
jgi:hypothetical protein